MKPSERLKLAREKLQKSVQETAAAANLKPATYYDLEGHENELFMTVSLAELSQLCKFLDIPLNALFSEKPEVKTEVNFIDLAVQIRNFLAQHNSSMEDFENMAGWELSEFLQNPKTAWGWNVDCLRDVCRVLGIDWLTALPDEKLEQA